MTNNQLTDEQIAQWLGDACMVIGDRFATVDELSAAKAIRALAVELQERRKAERDGEPNRNPVLAYADSYRDMAKQGVESVPIWSVITDLERNIAPLYRHAQPAPDDYFGSLVSAARLRADKAMCKYPQPNYVLNKVAEESGEVIKAVIHYHEGREEWASVEAELIDNLAMLIRLVVEGDQVIGFTPPEVCRAAMLQESQKSAGESNNCKSNEKVQDKSRCGTKAAPELGSLPKNVESRCSNSPAKDADVVNRLIIILPDASSNAFWSGTGKKEIFHPVTYRRWVKEAIERYCAIARIDVEVK